MKLVSTAGWVERLEEAVTLLWVNPFVFLFLQPYYDFTYSKNIIRSTRTGVGEIRKRDPKIEYKEKQIAKDTSDKGLLIQNTHRTFLYIKYKCKTQ